MKLFQYLASMIFVLAGIALLCVPPAHAAAAFAPTRFTVVDQGKSGAPDVVLIPGLSSSREVWAAEAKLLAPNYRLHLVQINGFAGQPAGPNAAGNILSGVMEELHEYIGANHLHPVVIGHSLGGLLTLMLADKYPDDVRKMIIVDALPSLAALYNPASTPESAKATAAAIRTQMLKVSDEQYEAMQKMMLPSMVRNPDGLKVVTENSSTSDRKIVVEAMAEDLETDLRGEVANIRTPALMLHPLDATASKEVAAIKADSLYENQYKPMPNVKLVRVDDSRHFIMFDQPQKFDELVEAFLK